MPPASSSVRILACGESTTSSSAGTVTVPSQVAVAVVPPTSSAVTTTSIGPLVEGMTSWCQVPPLPSRRSAAPAATCSPSISTRIAAIRCGARNVPEKRSTPFSASASSSGKESIVTSTSWPARTSCGCTIATGRNSACTSTSADSSGEFPSTITSSPARSASAVTAVPWCWALSS